VQYTTIELTGAVLFAIALLHTFSVKQFQHLAHRFPEGSVGENVFHLLGEVEAVFLLWAAIFIGAFAHLEGAHAAVEHVEHLEFTEPLFVFVIMTMAATKPVIDLVDWLIRLAAKLIPLPGTAGFFLSAIVIGPLLGSFITEPAAMTVTSFVLLRQIFERQVSQRFRYAMLGALFVHVSIGGTLTHFAAPPVLMVAHKWDWDMPYMLKHFGWKAASACILYGVFLTIVFFKELKALPLLADSDEHGKDAAQLPAPWWVTAVHVAALAFTVINAHHPKMFMGGFIFFLGFCHVTREFQEQLKLRESLLVAGFLAGLVTLGSVQSWWLKPLLASLSELPLYFGATALTAVTDNAALTYLGSQVQGLSEGMKYALVAGSVTGGGLTVIANAPNPAGFSILNRSFGEDGISPVGLFLAAVPPTIVAIICFLLLPSL
jgi:hypothetical protein